MKSLLQKARNRFVIGAAAVAFTAGVAIAQTVNVSTPEQPLATSLKQIAQQTGENILFTPGSVAGIQAHAISGQMTAQKAVETLLVGTNLEVASDGNGGLVVRPKNAQAASNEGAASRETETVVVTGTRIAGAPPASPVFELTRDQMLEAGQYTIGDAVRSLPQNFGGGQNPGVLNGASNSNINNQNITGASSINLRGLGADATLTLLNGRRLAYDSFTQAVDLSVIPVAALDRIEIVADGASAIYGSDAVAGVANIILRKDYDGVTATARLATATEGGDFQQQYSLVGGHVWDTGGFIATYNFEGDDGIYTRQRDYTRGLLNPNSLLPSHVSNSVVVSGHQDFGPDATFDLDAIFSQRTSITFTSGTPQFRQQNGSDSTNYTISPTVNIRLPANWSIAIGGVYGDDSAVTDSQTRSTLDGSLVEEFKQCQCNRVETIELSGTGPVFSLLGGDAQLAVGGGYRQNSYIDHFLTPNGTDISGNRHVYYGYGELFLPLVSPDQNVPFIEHLSVSGALRYEAYSAAGDIVTPKVGVVYAPSDDFELKGSWGKSFKAPTLIQEFSSPFADLLPATFFGAMGFPANATAIFVAGGNPNLKPEKSTSWTATLDVHPQALQGLRLQLSYFNIEYRDRVDFPVAVIQDAFNSPIYKEFLTFNPTLAQQERISALTASTGGIQNFSGGPYDPAAVAAIINDFYTNVTLQRINGVDVNAIDQVDVGSGQLVLTANASWLFSIQNTTKLSPTFNLAGTAFNPPNLRARLGASWSSDGFVASVYFNYLGGILNNTITPSVKGSAMTTTDLAILYPVTSPTEVVKGVDVSLSVQNLFDEKPPFLQANAPFFVSFDSTNYTPIGRFVSVSVTSRW